MPALQLGPNDWLTILGVGLVVVVFVWNGNNRVRWEADWNALGHQSMPIPEKRWTYDAGDLEHFAHAAKEARMLDRYVNAILLRSDLCFAIALAAITAFIWFEIAMTPTVWEVLRWAAFPLGAMAVLYGVADVAEDLKLATILRHPQSIDPADAAATNTLTRLKVATLILSVIGGLIFLVIAVVETSASRLLRRPRVAA